MSVFVPNIPIVLVTVHLVANSFFDHLSSLIVEHPLMTGFLQASRLVIIQLLPLDDFVSVSDRTSHFVLVFLLNWPAVLVEFGRADESLLHEMALSTPTTN